MDLVKISEGFSEEINEKCSKRTICEISGRIPNEISEGIHGEISNVISEEHLEQAMKKIFE